MRFRIRMEPVALLGILASCAPGGGQRQVARNEAALPMAPNSPCRARNPVRLIDVTSLRQTGQPRDEDITFNVAAGATACVTIENPDVDGHRVTAAWVELNGTQLLGPADFNQQFAGATFDTPLSGGAHHLRVRVASKPGTKLVISITVAGPVIDRISPEYGPAGTPVRIYGEGFEAPLTIQSRSTSLSGSTLISSTEAVASTVPELEIAPLTITTPFGSASSPRPFVPSEPRSLVPFYPQNEFDLPNGTCSGLARLLVRQDGASIAFVVEDQLPSSSLTLEIDRDSEHGSIDWSMAHTQPDFVSVFTQRFQTLDLHSHLNFGRLFLRVRSNGACGTRSSDWVDLRPVFAPGLVIVRSPNPAAIATRQGLQLVATEGELTLMKLSATMNMNDVLIALARDPDSQGALPDSVLYQTNHSGTQGSCGVAGSTVHESGPVPVAQWTLDRIGFGPTNHPQPLAGAGVVVAVLDTGIIATHPEFAGALIPGRDFTIFGDGSTADLDPGRHGTGVASVIAARAGNGGMIGVAPGATILPMRTLGATGMSDGFALHRAFAAVLATKAAGVNVQVVNASLAEFLDTYLLAGAIVARLVSVLNDASSASVVGGLVIREILRGGVRSLSAAGVAMIAASGNYGDTALSVFGMQFPASAPETFAVAATDQADRVIPGSMRALPGQRISLSAPSEVRAANGSTSAGTQAATSGTPPVACVGGGTSYAAPHVAGAVAALLSPAPPIARPLGVTDGLTAALRLVATARPIADPPNAGGAGLLNLQQAQLPAFVWGLEFQTNFRLIDDFAFLPNVSDFALRANGTRLEGITAPGANVTVSVALPAQAAWVNALPATSEVLLGYPSGIEVRTASGSSPRVVQTVASTFRAAVSTTSTAAGNLIAIGMMTGELRLVRGANFGNVATLTPSQSGERFLDAVWVTRPSGTDEFIAARTANRVELFRVPANVALGCVAGAAGCPSHVGSVLLTFAGTAGVTAVSPTDWAAVNEGGRTRILAVDGTGRIFGGISGGQLTIVTEHPRFAFREIEASQTTSYVLDPAAPAVVAISNGTVLAIDSQRFGEARFQTQSPLRIAPSGTYAYAAARSLRVPNESWAVFLGGLVP